MFCKNCGKECKMGVKFCSQCGSKLEFEVTKIQPREPAGVQAAKQLEQPKNTEKNNNQNTFKNQMNEKNSIPVSKKGNENKKVIMACLVTLLVACVGFGAFYYFFLRKPDMQTDTMAQATTTPAATDVSGSNQTASAEPTATPVVQREKVTLDITAVDTANFPKVTLYFSVKDLANQFIDTIDASQLSVFEKQNGNSQNWTEVSTSINYHGKQEANEKSVAFVMDTSGSMQDCLGEECNAADALLAKMEQDGNYKAAFTAFSDTQHDWLDYTEDFVEFRDYLDYLVADGDTAFYDTLKNTLDHAFYQTGQKYILAFTDGEDNASYTGYSEILELSKSYKIPIYIITTLDADSDYVSDVEEIAEVSGGSLYTIHSIEDLEDIYYEVFELQREQFSLTYESSQKNNFSDIRLQFLSDTYEGEGTESYYAEKPKQYNTLPEIDTITASSVRESMYDSNKRWCTYGAENVWDGNNRTSWTEGENGDGIGEYLIIKLKEESQVSGINISNGYYKSKELYYRNNRMKKVKLTFSDGTSKKYTLDDEFLSPCGIVFDEPVVTSTIKVEILSVYQCKSVNGKKAYDDTCITELEVY